MKCLWIQKVSLLMDGELERAEARDVEQHLDTCGDCHEAREDFLLLRRQLTAYQIDFDAFAGQRALKSILASSGAGGAKTEQDAVNPRRRDEWFAGVFGMPRLSPVGLAALLLLLVGVAIGVVSFINTRRPHVDFAKTAPAPVKDIQRNSNGKAQTAPPSAPNDASAGINDGRQTIAGNDRQQADEELTTAGAKRPTAFEQTRERALRNERLPRVERVRRQVEKSPSSPRLDQPQVDPPVAEMAINSVEAFDNSVGASESNDAGEELSARRARDVSRDSKTARHVEQAQLLLRSFRNARLADEGHRASTDIAYDKRQSKKLLYQNIVLRREAASRGNLPVESLLDSLEPILIDIANLPDKPAPADVREINERMRRKNLVAMLQISSVESASARSY